MAGFFVTPVGATQQQITTFAENVMFDAVVDVNGNGDFTTISGAINAGHKTIYLRKGTYAESADITLPSGFVIIGESVTECIVVFSGAFGFVYDGSGGTKENTGTISVNDGFSGSTKIVTGSGTTFTNLSPGDYISIRGIFYEIESIGGDTTITLVRDHEGTSGSGLSYVAQTCVVGGRLENITVTGSQKEAVFVRAATGFSMQNCLISVNFDGAIVEDSCCCYVLGCMLTNNNSAGVNDSHGIKITNSYFLQLSTSSFSNNEGDGINISGDSFSNVSVDGCIISENRDKGLNIVSGESVIVSDSLFSGNRGVQLESTSSSKRLTVTSCSLSNGSTHCIDLSGEKSLVSSCVVDNNVGVGIVCRGSEVVVIGCQVSGNSNDGIGSPFTSVSKLILLGNYSKDNTGDGIDLGSNGTNATIIGNVVEGNSGDGIDADGANSGVIFGNFATGNSGLNYNLSDSTKSALIAEEIEVGWYVADPTSTGINVAGFLKIPSTHFIQEVHVALDQRGDTGNTIVDINSHNVNPTQGVQKNNQAGTTIYTTSGNRPDLVGDTATLTQNSFLWAANPDVRDFDEDYYLSLDIDTVTTNSVGLSVRLVLKRIPS